MKFVCCYCSLLYSGSINSTPLLSSFVRCVDIKYEFKKKKKKKKESLKKVKTARYE